MFLGYNSLRNVVPRGIQPFSAGGPIYLIALKQICPWARARDAKFFHDKNYFLLLFFMVKTFGKFISEINFLKEIISVT